MLARIYFPGKSIGDRDSYLVRLASLIEQIEHGVRTEARILRARRRGESPNAIDSFLSDEEFEKKGGKLGNLFPFGCILAEFMEERGLITFTDGLTESVKICNKKNEFYIPKNISAINNFDISLLPIRLNLPMICPPVAWKKIRSSNHTTLSDLTGGYLSTPSGDIYDRYCLMSSHDPKHFYIEMTSQDQVDGLCSIMNKLQNQPFEINSEWLHFMIDHDDSLVRLGLLMPKFLASINLHKASSLLREFHMQNKEIKSLFSYEVLLKSLSNNIQRASYERFLIRLAGVFEGYQFYLPAFLDFRGRIYRCGVLHFHERDLARSLVLFGGEIPESSNDEAVWAQIGFHCKSFTSSSQAISYVANTLLEGLSTTDGDRRDDYEIVLLHQAREAKRPFQFLSNMLLMLNASSNRCKIPITQDASASAYQILSYFLLDETLAFRTNLIPSPNGEIEDIYTYFLMEFMQYLKEEGKKGLLSNDLVKSVCSLLNRKIMKSFFMPVVYGKTMKAYADDLYNAFSHYLTKGDCFKISKACFTFWGIKYAGMKSLIELIRCIGWIVSSNGNPVTYKVPYYNTVQDYIKMKTIKVSVYDKERKLHRISLRIKTSERHPAKTKVATFANFIHQKDANIAMNVVEQMLSIGAPIYTVHDNFITTQGFSKALPDVYTYVICGLVPPLSIINEYIYMNLIPGYYYDPGVSPLKKIPRAVLYGYLISNMPNNIKRKKTWHETINKILDSYDEYANRVCVGDYMRDKSLFHGNELEYASQAEAAHYLNWANFLKKMERGDLPNYSIHY